MGYVDHPAMVAAVARLARAIFGDSLVGLRAFSALAAAVTVLVAAEIARATGGARFARALAAFAAAVAPHDLVVGQIYSMNVMCGNDGYWLWGPPAAWPSAVVAIGYGADDLATFFDDVHEAARFDQPFAAHAGRRRVAAPRTLEVVRWR